MISKGNLNHTFTEHDRRRLKALCEVIELLTFQNLCRRALNDPFVLVSKVGEDEFMLLTSDGPAPQQRVH